ncbi:NUDIX domain-containing protein [Paramicrobacterium chengjingii]|uniref:NUDIX hydrolase n=1 Tax=Paramicrobacterium chengjingii TaxID=2769067 RepID=A0ABX6YN64_9MICO|nr:NUDIX hydrolase [Microbacterium chengjingii]QPZ40273.1 NUDIX hydrolase [Microbacterium chengjingii]
MRPLHDEITPAELESSDVAFHGHVWDIRRDTFRLNNASITREYMDHTGAVAILALDEHDRVLLINQYRHPVRARLWEIPAGLLDINAEHPLDAAKRELAEEADVEANEWAVLSEFYTSPGSSDEAIRIYLARGISALPERFDREDEEADIEKRWVNLDEITDAVRARAVQNPSLVTGVLSAFIARQRDWTGLGAADSDWPRLRQRGIAE